MSYTSKGPRLWAQLCILSLPLLAACATTELEHSPPLPRPSLPPKAAQIYTPSVQAQELSAYYRSLEQDLLTRGLLRTDGGGPDTPYDAEDLATQFEQLAFYDEYGSRTQGNSPGGLARWEDPVVLKAVFGPSVTARQKARDQRILRSYAIRLARVTGHPVRLGGEARRSNFTVIFAGIDDAEFVQDQVLRTLPHLSTADLALFTTPPRQFYCLVTAGGLRQSPLTYTRGVALIRAEQPDLMRQACIHEEVAQGLGLRNDSPRARPSIFNDDDEFALLTSYDESLLKMLYDARLSPGMNAEDARPIVAKIAQTYWAQTHEPQTSANSDDTQYVPISWRHEDPPLF